MSGKIKERKKLIDLLQKLHHDGYNAELIGRDGEPLYVAVEHSHRVIVIDYLEEINLYDVGEVGCNLPYATYSLGFFYGFKKYSSSTIETYVREIEPNPELFLGGKEKFEKLCALDYNSPDFCAQFGDLYDEYAYPKDSSEYRRAFQQWMQDKNLSVIL